MIDVVGKVDGEVYVLSMSRDTADVDMIRDERINEGTVTVLKPSLHLYNSCCESTLPSLRYNQDVRTSSAG